MCVCVSFSRFSGHICIQMFGVLAEVLEWTANQKMNQRDHGGTLVSVAAAFASDFGPVSSWRWNKTPACLSLKIFEVSNHVRRFPQMGGVPILIIHLHQSFPFYSHIIHNLDHLNRNLSIIIHLNRFSICSMINHSIYPAIVNENSRILKSTVPYFWPYFGGISPAP